MVSLLYITLEVYTSFGRGSDALKTNTPIYVEDVEKIRRKYPEENAVYVEREIRSVLAVPYRMRETGFLLLENITLKSAI